MERERERGRETSLFLVGLDGCILSTVYVPYEDSWLCLYGVSFLITETFVVFATRVCCSFFLFHLSCICFDNIVTMKDLLYELGRLARSFTRRRWI